MIARVPSFLRSAPTPPVLRSDPGQAPLVLSATMRSRETNDSDLAFAEAHDRIDRLFATL